MKNKKKVLENKLELELIYEELDQHDYVSDDDLTEKKEAKYAKLIGSFLISFSELEHDIDRFIAQLINERGDSPGYIIIKDLDVSQKIELFYNIALPKIACQEQE